MSEEVQENYILSIQWIFAHAIENSRKIHFMDVLILIG